MKKINKLIIYEIFKKKLRSKMKIFFYKTVFSFFYFLFWHFISLNYTVKKISTLVDEKTSKEAFELIKKTLEKN